MTDRGAMRPTTTPFTLHSGSIIEQETTTGDESMKQDEQVLHTESGADVIVISRRSFFGALLGIGTAAMGAMLVVPVMRYMLYPLYAKNKGTWWSKVMPKKQIPPPNANPVLKNITFNQRDGWREIVTREAVYAETLPSGETLVLSSICPHLGCSVEWQNDKDRFYCPCHGSVYNRDGKHVAGPAPRGMDPLPTDVQDGNLMVHFEYFREDVPNREIIGQA
ncbi:MAG: ubiquinol-cytochrome c reductase iron-sulfur subunit [Terracidiphilus sp.]